MVSQVSAQTPGASLLSILHSLFPSGSVTGAPTIRAMEIIGKLEQSPRGIYTGAIGHIKPGGDFQFNVAIRTLELTPDRRGRIHVGSGIVADSSPNSEYAECWSKARFLTELPSDFALLETLLVDDGELKRLDAHLERLRESAQFFGFTFSKSIAKDILLRASEKNPQRRHRIRLTLQQDGRFDMQVHPLAPLRRRLSCVLSPVRTASDDLLLRHKTTARGLYDEALARLKGSSTVFDALFFNELGELTEGARTNTFLVKNGTWFTPPVECGLLNGIMRQEILRTREVSEQKLYYQDLVTADAIYLANALRGLFRVALKKRLPFCVRNHRERIESP